MWIEKLNDAIVKSGMTNKQLAEKSRVSEKTINRIRKAGGASQPSLDTLGELCGALGTTLEEIFSESSARLASGDLITLQNEVDRLTAENALIVAENSMLKDKVGVLSTEIDLLHTKLEHKEEIIALHNYYNSIIKSMENK
jgi:transcriptional regulator with XRE-family HTH domain